MTRNLCGFYYNCATYNVRTKNRWVEHFLWYMQKPPENISIFFLRFWASSKAFLNFNYLSTSYLSLSLIRLYYSQNFQIFIASFTLVPFRLISTVFHVTFLYIICLICTCGKGRVNMTENFRRSIFVQFLFCDWNPFKASHIRKTRYNRLAAKASMVWD